MPEDFKFQKPDRYRGFLSAAWEEVQSKAPPLAGLGRDRIEHIAAMWYEASEEVLMSGQLDLLEEAVRQIAEEVQSSGFSREEFLEVLRLLRATAVRLKWNEDQLDDLDSLIDMLLPHLGTVPEDWRMPVGFSYREGKVKEEGPEVPTGPVPAQPTPPLAAAREKRERKRTKLELPARISPADPDWAEVEITRTVNICRSGIYIFSMLPYKTNMRLFVSCPYSGEPGALNREYLGEVVRVDFIAGQSHRGIAIKFLRTV